MRLVVRAWFFALVSFGLLLAPPQGLAQDPGRYRGAIAAYLEQDATNPPPKNSILFVGSSIMRLWGTLAEDMAPLPVFNRAFGGSQTPDILYYMDKIVLPYQPRIIVYYCGSNDVNAGKAAEPIFENFRVFAERVRAALPDTRIFYLAIQKAPDKRKRWDVVDRANGMVRDYCARGRKLGFIDTNPVLFNADGEPRMELYLADNLHFKAPAYVEFTRVIRPVLEKAWAEE